jgi:hypothetical protein
MVGQRQPKAIVAKAAQVKIKTNAQWGYRKNNKRATIKNNKFILLI